MVTVGRLGVAVDGVRGALLCGGLVHTVGSSQSCQCHSGECRVSPGSSGVHLEKNVPGLAVVEHVLGKPVLVISWRGNHRCCTFVPSQMSICQSRCRLGEECAWACIS